MAITEHTEKRRLIVTLGAHEAPASWQWEGVRFLKNDDGSDAASPHPCRLETTREEASALLGDALVKQQGDIADDTAKIGELQTENARLTKELKAATAKLEAVKQALEAS